MSTAATAPAGEAVPRGGVFAAYALTLLLLANVFNYADRALLGIVIEPIRKELLLSDTEIGIISGLAFSIFFLAAGLAIARWVDRGNRRLILVLGLALWSCATAATTFAQGFTSLAFTRMLVGIGEATLFPVAMSLLADLYPGAKRTLMVSIFQASSGIGIVVGSVLAGVLAAALGWRTMFEIFGAAGMVLVTLMALTMRPTPRTAVVASQRTSGLWIAIRSVLAVPGMPWLALGYGASNMVLASLPVWSPAFLLRSHGVKLAEVGALVGGPAVIGGITGGICAGLLATRLIKRSGNRWAGLIVPMVALPLAIPAYAVFLFAPTLPVVLVGIAVMNFLLSTGLGPCAALAVSLVPASERGVTSTVMLIVQNILAFAIGPLVIGVASDLLTPHFGAESLRYALATMLVAPVVASAFLWVARRRIRAAARD
ncbi:spinster family MFS transporter [Glacieibacterium megasporae]|uniref:spinster family MFS transporter n=1 Tax=Glacieibacterium megasporae TaxID=2835787 RepID=UPI001C1DDC6E|nr:MFS transporter [Polymorphobacter megasporae]UAJ12566.1 MFS transporter [Polymorphobacter megasporae]